MPNTASGGRTRHTQDGHTAGDGQGIDMNSPINPKHDSQPTKKRKLRRGTQSCWECKRRKAKCTWATEAGTKRSCDGCKRRGSTCVSQEYEDDPVNQKQQLSDRVSRLEELIVRRAWKHRDGTTEHPRAPVESDTSRLVSSSSVHRSRQDQSPDNGLTVSLIPEAENLWSNKSLSKALLEVWPSIEDLSAIIVAPMGVEVFHTINCFHRADASRSGLPSAADILKIPDSGMKPVFIGRSLLYLASFLQCLTPKAITDLRRELSLPPEVIMDKAFTTAARLVTSDLELVLSIEGIECIMMESLYHNNAGRLRSAWSATRRAMSTAQLMGLDQTNDTHNTRKLNRQQRIDPEYMWLRIIEMDSYLSLQLGLPLGASHAEPSSPDLMARAEPQERLERAMVHAAVFICQRSTSGILDLRKTREVDSILLQASKDMSAAWWLIPDLGGSSSNREAILAKANRFMMQMAFYHTLERLHLPYLVNRATERASDYNRTTALHASREVLRRFVAFRRETPVGSHFCRGIDFLAFGACTAICIGRIQDRFPPEHVVSGSCRRPSSSGNPMEHQVLTDRGLMESAKQQLEVAADHCLSDPIAGRIVNGLTHLLAIDADVANGKAFKLDETGKQEGSDPGTLSQGSFDDGDFIVTIPHIGDIKFVRQSLSRGLHRNVTSTMPDVTSNEGHPSSRRPSLTFQDDGQDHMNIGPPIAESDFAGIPGLASIDDSGLHQSFTQFSDYLTGGDMGMQGVETAWFDTLFMGYDESFPG